MKLPGFTADASIRSAGAPAVSSMGSARFGATPNATVRPQQVDTSDPTVTRYCFLHCWPGGFCEYTCHHLYY
jgi:hypothetical protein